MATTSSPTWRSLTSPSVAGVRFVASILRTARSVGASVPTISAVSGAVITEGDGDAAGQTAIQADNVIVGNDVPLLVDNDAGADSPGRDRPAQDVQGGAFGLDAYHRGAQQPDDVGDAQGLAAAGWDRGGRGRAGRGRGRWGGAGGFGRRGTARPRPCRRTGLEPGPGERAKSRKTARRRARRISISFPRPPPVRRRDDA